MTEVSFQDLEEAIETADAEEQALNEWMLAIVRDYEDRSSSKLTQGEICLKHNCTHQELNDILDLTGTSRRKPIFKPTPEILSAAKDYVSEGITATRAAERHGADYPKLLRHLRRTRQMRPRTHKVIPDQAIKDYQNRVPVTEILRKYRAEDGRKIYPTELYTELARRGIETWAEGRWQRAMGRSQGSE